MLGWPMEGQPVDEHSMEAAPRMTAPMARMIMGTIMGAPDSCGCAGSLRPQWSNGPCRERHEEEAGHGKNAVTAGADQGGGSVDPAGSVASDPAGIVGAAASMNCRFDQ